MSAVTKLQPIIIVAIAFLGILLGTQQTIKEVSGGLIEPSLMLLLFIVFLSVDFSSLTKALKHNKLTGLSLLINFIWTPSFAMLLAKFFLGESIDLQIGLVMLLVTPCTDWYLVFTKMAKGNVGASAALLPINLILQMVLLPIYLFLFMGGSISFNPIEMLLSIAFVLATPFAVACLVKIISSKLGKRKSMAASLEKQGDGLQLIFLCGALCAMFASQGDLVLSNPGVFLTLLGPLAVFFIATYFISSITGKLAKLSYEDTTSLTFTATARNSPLSLAIAMSAFPDQPLIGLALAIGPLIELPVLALISFALKSRLRKLDRL